MHIAIIGAGAVGGALGRGWSRAGHSIVYGVPDPGDSKYARTAQDAGDAALFTVEQAARTSDVTVLAVPWPAIEAVAQALGNMSGRIVIDATNPLRMGPDGLELAVGFDMSGGETISRLLPGAHVVKTMNQVGFAVMDATNGYPAAPSMFVAGADDGARAAVSALVSDLGFAAIDAGPLRIARLLEGYAMLWIHMAVNQGRSPTSAFALMHRKAEMVREPL